MRLLARAALVGPSLALLAACGSTGSPAAPEAPATAAETPRLVWQWRRLGAGGAAAPDARSHGAAVYDPVGGRLIVFGGESDAALLNDVWAFDTASGAWSPLPTRGRAPEPRRGADAVYDPMGHQMVVWAGQNGSRFFNDTWTLDLRTLEWRDVSPAQRPQARYGSASVFDPAERRLVQFAGFTDLFRRFQDTQAFDLDTHTWEDLTPADSRPAFRCLVTAALDARSRRMVVYGGQQTGPLDDVWAFDLGSRRWTELTPETRPEGRMLATSFVDRDGRFVVFGGSTRTANVNDTWAFDLASREWSRLEVGGAPPPREAALGAAADDGGRFLVFGGRDGGRLNDLWELRLVPDASGR
jgi:hypothetical protein